MITNSLLIVDDEVSVRTIVSRLAQARGFQVTEAGSAGEALDRMAESPAAIAMCDIGMPDRDGLWLADQLQQQFPDTAVVILSGYGESRRESSLNRGAMGYLSKPFTRKELLATLDAAVLWRSLGRSNRGFSDVVQLQPAVKAPSI
jgi:CheY-like chemotaxis protein